MCAKQALAALAFLLAGFIAFSWAEEAKAPKGHGSRTEGKPALRAVALDFQEELHLDLPSLKALGVRVDRAREARDAVSLAVAATELAAAEKVSGRRASIQSADLFKEAVEIASRRHAVPELEMVALLVPDPASKKKLDGAVSRARKLGANSRDVGNGAQNLTVVNRADRGIAIFFNDEYVGAVNPGTSRSFGVYPNPAYPQDKLWGRGRGKTWGPIYIGTAWDRYTWTLTP